MKNTIVDFVIDTLILCAYAAVIAILAIGALAMFGHHVGWWHAYVVSLMLVYCRVLIFDTDWIR
jgi:type IV secretory pathway VirB2 component (pilin)